VVRRTLKVRLQAFRVYIWWDGISVSKGVISSVVRFLSFTAFFVLSLHLETFFYNFLRTRDFTRDAAARLSFFSNFYSPFFFRLLLSSLRFNTTFSGQAGPQFLTSSFVFGGKVSFVLFSTGGGVSEKLGRSKKRKMDGWWRGQWANY
jgi:hypothetical protein